MDIVIWVTIFIAALVVLVKGADWLLDGAEKIGVAVGFSPFIVGVLLVGVGTSFPELISSIAAVMRGAPEIVVANAVGSNIANIFLVIGFAAVVARQLVVTKSLIDLDLPLIALSTALLIGIIFDGSVSFYESVLLVLGYLVYFLYTVQERETKETASEENVVDVIPPPRHGYIKPKSETLKKLRAPEALLKNVGLLLVGIVALVAGAKYLIDAVLMLSKLLDIGTSTIALLAVAFGTSLPEVAVSFKAAKQKNSEVVLGNILGSNVFNALAVVGIPGLFARLPVGESVLLLGLPTMIIATLLFVISGISRRIHKWEGLMYLILYVLFVAKLFGL